MSADELDTAILAIQTADLEKLSKHASEAPKISGDEIRVRVSGPNQMDLIVVDQPGIINNGAGREETRDLIRRHISPLQTLILLVSEAKQDEELTSAIELAKEVDPAGTRTMRILTKFDTFDSEEAKSTAVALLAAQRGQKLGAHAVICRTNGKGYDSAEETRELFSAGVPAARGGIDNLKGRLPRIYAELIATNLPLLKASAEQLLHASKQELHTLGDAPLEPIAMIRECQRILIDKRTFMKEMATPCFHEFQEAIHLTGESITQEWVAQRINPNVFDAPFFQGEPAFIDCLEAIAEMWKPCVLTLVDEVEKVLLGSMKPVETAAGVSGRLATTIQMKWVAHSEALLRTFKSEALASLKEERDFGTVNHYLSDKFVAETLVPTGMIDKFVADMTWERFYRKLVRPNDPATTLFDSNTRVHGPHVKNIGDVDWKAGLTDMLVEAKEEWAKEFGRKTLHEQLLYRVFAAVKAAWAVEKKTYTDMVLKKCRDAVMKARIDWVETTLLMDTDIRAEALEDRSVELKRAELKATIAAMQASLEELKKIM